MGVDDAEALCARCLVAAGAEELEAQADAEGGAVGLEAFFDDGVKVVRSESLDAWAERADAREDEVGGGARTIGVVGEFDLCAEAGERGGDGGRVGDAGVDDGGRRVGRGHVSVPLVLGMPAVSSTATAWRRAIARALKQASALW